MKMSCAKRKMIKWVLVGVIKLVVFLLAGLGFWLGIAFIVDWLDGIDALEGVLNAFLLVVGLFLFVVLSIGIAERIERQYRMFERECEE